MLLRQRRQPPAAVQRLLLMVSRTERAVNGRSGRAPLGHRRQRPVRRVRGPAAGGRLLRRALLGGPVRGRRFGRRRAGDGRGIGDGPLQWRKTHPLRAASGRGRLAGGVAGVGFLEGAPLEDRLEPLAAATRGPRRGVLLRRLVDGRRLQHAGRRLPDAPDGGPLWRPADEPTDPAVRRRGAGPRVAVDGGRVLL